MLITGDVEALRQSGMAPWGIWLQQGKLPMRQVLGHLAKPRDKIKAHQQRMSNALMSVGSNPFIQVVRNECPARRNVRAGLKSEHGSPDFQLWQLALTPP